MRDLALEHAAARLDDAEHLARMARLRGELEIVGGGWREGTGSGRSSGRGSRDGP